MADPVPVGGPPAPGAAPEPPAPGWRELRALWPLVVLLALVAEWTHLQFESTVSAISASAAVVAVAGLLKWLPEGTGKGAALDAANALRSHTLARRLWGASALFLGGTLLLGSVRVRRDDLAPRTRIYPIDPAGASTAAGASRSARSLDDKNATRSFHVTLPLGRAVMFATTANQVSTVARSWPWLVPTLTYPDDFRPLPELAVLLSPNLRLLMGHGRWLRLLVLSGDAGAEVLAEDTLRTYGSRVVVFDSARVAADSLALRWRPIATDSLKLDTALTAAVVGEWVSLRRPVHSRRLLVPGQHVRAVLVNQHNDTIGNMRTTLSSGLSNVVLRD